MFSSVRNLSPQQKAERARYMRQWFWIRAPAIIVAACFVQLLTSGNPLGRAELKYFVQVTVASLVLGLPIYRLLLSRHWDKTRRRDHSDRTN